jgi:N-acetylmuramoyl-L-alanine amidase
MRLRVAAVLLSCITISALSLTGCSSEEQYTPRVYSTPRLNDSVVRASMASNLNTYNSSSSFNSFKKYTPPKKFSPRPAAKPLAGKTIVIDPGHGGKDPGAGEVGFSRLPEKSIVLDISLKVADELAAKGARVILTRKGDYFIDLDRRGLIAEHRKADLFVSIHADACPKNPQASGPTIFVARQSSWQSRKSANAVHKSFRRFGMDSRGIRKADYRVLVGHSRPAILVETGFLTNYADAKNLNQNWYRDRVATAISHGIEASLVSRFVNANKSYADTTMQ